MNPLGLSLGETLKRDSWREMVKLSREGTEDKRIRGSGNCWLGTLFHVFGVEGRLYRGVRESKMESIKMLRVGK